MQFQRIRVIALTALMFVYSCAGSDSCIHRWPLDEDPGSKTVADVVGRAGAVVKGARLGLPGKRATAVSVDGNGGYVIADIADRALVQYTVALWVKASALGQSQFSAVINNYDNRLGETDESFRDSFQIDVDGSSPGNYRITFESDQQIFGPVTPEWQHLAVTYDRATVRTYVNGVVIESRSLAPGLAGTNFRHMVLGRNRRGNQYFNGLVDEVQIYNRALNQNEVSALATDNANRLCD